MPGRFSNGETIVLVLVGIGAGMCLAGTASPFWSVMDIKADSIVVTENTNVQVGLWQVCIKKNDVTECNLIKMDRLSSKYQSVRSLSLIVPLTGIVSIGLAFRFLGGKFFVVAIVIIAAGIFGISAIATYASIYKKESAELVFGFSYASLQEAASLGTSFALFTTGTLIMTLIPLLAFFLAYKS